MDLVLLGPPGAGKGTQAKRLSDRLKLPHIATGDVLREAVRTGTPRGREAQSYMNRGDLVPDEVILAIMKERLASEEASRGAILDGVVRTEPQAKGLEEVLHELDRSVDRVLIFHVSDEQLIQRLAARTSCEQCGTPYSGRQPGERCEKCGGKLVRRKDDEPVAVKNRLEVYRRQTEPVIDWYRRNGTSISEIDAVGTPDEVTTRALRALGK